MNSAREAGEARTPFRWGDEQVPRPRLTLEKVSQLVRAALPSGEDEAARALIQLLAGIAYEPDALQRDVLTVCAAEEAYTLTEAFSCALDAFAMGGEAEQKE